MYWISSTWLARISLLATVTGCGSVTGPSAQSWPASGVTLTPAAKTMIPKLQQHWNATNDAAAMLDSELSMPLSELLREMMTELDEKCSDDIALFGGSIPDIQTIPIVGFREAQEILDSQFDSDQGSPAILIVPEQHLPVAQEAARAGKHVYTEKPIAATASTSVAIVIARPCTNGDGRYTTRTSCFPAGMPTERKA